MPPRDPKPSEVAEFVMVVFLCAVLVLFAGLVIFDLASGGTP